MLLLYIYGTTELDMISSEPCAFCIYIHIYIDIY